MAMEEISGLVRITTANKSIRLPPHCGVPNAPWTESKRTLQMEFRAVSSPDEYLLEGREEGDGGSAVSNLQNLCTVHVTAFEPITEV